MLNAIFNVAVSSCYYLQYFLHHHKAQKMLGKLGLDAKLRRQSHKPTQSLPNLNNIKISLYHK